MAPRSQASALASRPPAGHYVGSWQGKGITTLVCLSPTTHAVGQRSTDPHLQVEDAPEADRSAQSTLCQRLPFWSFAEKALATTGGYARREEHPGLS